MTSPVYGVSGVNAVVRWLDRASAQPGARLMTGVLYSLAKTIRTGRWHSFRYNRHGYWVNRQRDAVFFSPTLHTASVAGLFAEVADYWCYVTALQPGDTVVDIGAGVGDHVFTFSRLVGSRGRVVAIEAHPTTARCLKLTVATNCLDNVLVIEEAAWDRDGTLQISDDQTHAQNAVIGAARGLVVRARTADHMLESLQIDCIDLLKMNIEGAEVGALSGMAETLAKTRAIVVSCHDFLATGGHDDLRRTKTRVIALLLAAGFDVSTRPDAPHGFMRDYVYGRRVSP